MGIFFKDEKSKLMELLIIFYHQRKTIWKGSITIYNGDKVDLMMLI